MPTRAGEAGYEVPLFSSEQRGARVVRSTPNEAGRALRAAARDRTRRANGAQNQRWFRDQAADAVQALRELIGPATAVLLCDPYFGGDDLLRVVLAITDLKVPVRILTSAKFLRYGHRGGTTEAAHLTSRLAEARATMPINPIEVHVMPGDHPAIHDRFLHVGERLCMLGSSINHFGGRGTLMVAVPDPDPVLEDLERVWDASAHLPARLLRTLHAKRQHSGGQPARGAQGSALTALRAALVIAPDEPANDVELFEWFAELLTSPAADWDAFTHQQALDGLLAALARRVARVDDIVERCDGVYRSLELGRRCGEFACGRGLNEAQRASLVLLALLLHVLERRGIEAPNMREALARTFERALRLALVSQPLPVAGSVRPRALVTLAVAVSAKLDPESLPTRFAPLRSDPGHAAECVKVLLDVVPEELLRRVLGVATLQDFAKSVDTWVCATDHPDDRAAAASLAAALDVKRSEGAVVQAGPPLTTRLRSSGRRRLPRVRRIAGALLLRVPSSRTASLRAEDDRDKASAGPSTSASR